MNLYQIKPTVIVRDKNTLVGLHLKFLKMNFRALTHFLPFIFLHLTTVRDFFMAKEELKTKLKTNQLFASGANLFVYLCVISASRSPSHLCFGLFFSYPPLLFLLFYKLIKKLQSLGIQN